MVENAISASSVAPLERGGVMTRAPGLLALGIHLPDDFEVSHRRILANAIAEELLAIAAASLSYFVSTA